MVGKLLIKQRQMWNLAKHRLGEELAVWVRLNEDAVGSEITEDLVNSLTFC